MEPTIKEVVDALSKDKGILELANKSEDAYKAASTAVVSSESSKQDREAAIKANTDASKAFRDAVRAKVPSYLSENAIYDVMGKLKEVADKSRTKGLSGAAMAEPPIPMGKNEQPDKQEVKSQNAGWEDRAWADAVIGSSDAFIVEPPIPMGKNEQPDKQEVKSQNAGWIGAAIDFATNSMKKLGPNGLLPTIPDADKLGKATPSQAGGGVSEEIGKGGR
jgi:hypothetical protein